LVLEHYCKVLDTLGILYASLKQDGLGPELYIRIVSWCSYIDQEFTDCATQRRPRALIIMAYYLVFIKVIKGLWWLEGIPDRDIGRILKTLGPRWTPFLEVPLQASMMADKGEIAALLLRWDVEINYFAPSGLFEIRATKSLRDFQDVWRAYSTQRGLTSSQVKRSSNLWRLEGSFIANTFEWLLEIPLYRGGQESEGAMTEAILEEGWESFWSLYWWSVPGQAYHFP
jgi:hypothetical protein